MSVKATHDGVELADADPPAQVARASGRPALRVAHRDLPSTVRLVSRAGRGTARRCRRSARSMTRAGLVGVAREDGRHDRRVLGGRSGRCSRRARGSRWSISCSSAWTAVTAAIVSGEPRQGGDREVEPRVAPAGARPAGGARRRPSCAARAVDACAVVRSRPRGERGRARLDDARKRASRAGPRACHGRCSCPARRGIPGGSTTVPPPRPRVVSTRPAARSAAIASRSVARETPMRSANSRSDGRLRAARVDASRIAVASCSTQRLERVVSTYRSQRRSVAGVDCVGEGRHGHSLDAHSQVNPESMV